MLPLVAFFYFNPRSHERSDVNVPPSTLSPLISIHAPTRGATSIFQIPLQHLLISIHAPTRGATSSPMPLDTYHCSFQSTLPREERPCDDITALISGNISIHAPTRGATAPRLHATPTKTISIHAPTRGATCSTKCQKAGTKKFQSTLPREERPKPFIYKALRTIISIHAPTRGATKC